jgi:hypothetical protein
MMKGHPGAIFPQSRDLKHEMGLRVVGLDDVRINFANELLQLQDRAGIKAKMLLEAISGDAECHGCLGKLIWSVGRISVAAFERGERQFNYAGFTLPAGTVKAQEIFHRSSDCLRLNQRQDTQW